MPSRQSHVFGGTYESPAFPRFEGFGGFMTEQRSLTSTAERVTLVAGLLAAQLGLLVLVGWHTANSTVIQPGSQLPPMPYNAALAFVFCGSGLIAAALRSTRTGLFCGLMTGVIGLVTLSEYLLHLEAGFDTWLMEPYLAFGDLHPGRMSPSTALSLVLAGCGLTLASRRQWLAFRPLLVRFIGLLVAALGVICLFGGMSGMSLTSTWGRFTGMAVHTAGGLVLAGVGVSSLGWREPTTGDVCWRVGFPGLIAVALGTITLMLWQGLSAQEHAQLQRNVQLATTKVQDAIRVQTETQIRALISMARRWEQWENFPRIWEYDAGLYMRDHPAYQSIQWVDANSQARWQIPPAKDRDAAAPPAPELLGILKAAREHREAVMSRAFHLAHGDEAFLVAVPVFRRPDFRESAGAIVAVCSAGEFFGAILKEHGVRGYAVVVYDGADEIYRRGHASALIERDWGHEGSVDLYSTVWRLRVWPEPSLLHAEDSFAPEAALVVGLLMTVLVTMVVYFAHAVQLRARQAESARRRLENEVNERRRAEEALAGKAAELARSNQELEQFAYVASHDLQEPLRKIQAFGDRLEEECECSLGNEGRDYLQRMQSAAGRMQTLIDDLLELSRVTTMGRPFTSVDLNVVAREVVSDLEASIEQVRGRVEIGGLPTLEADPIQMRQLLQNLISNALKFHQPDVPPVVEVYGTQLEDHDETRCQLTISDNGIGFDEQYLDRIFAVFQRLHGRDQYDGTGVGLALCRKIVERHGGCITARSSPGQGATFVVMLPAVHVERGTRA